MIAKRFFYVCAGLACLTLVYHLGARSARAQVGGPIDLGNTDGSADFSALVGRTLYTLHHYNGIAVMPPVPGTDPIIAVGGGWGDRGALLSNGDAWACYQHSATEPFEWHYEGNVFSGLPTDIARRTWGATKAQYRIERSGAVPHNR